jgi:NAD binding domain of 6-phosphogluconate dehydrogenase/Glycosyltransferase family 36
MADAFLLSNGRCRVMVTAAGSGYSQWPDIAVSRGREDVAIDDRGTFFLERRGNQLRVRPLLSKEWPGFELDYRYGAATYRIVCRAASTEGWFTLIDDSARNEVAMSVRRDVRRATPRDQSRRRTRMQLAMIGLGRLGVSTVRPLIAKGHECVLHDLQPAVAARQKAGASGAASLADFAATTEQPRAIWLVVPETAVRRDFGGHVEKKAGGAE